MRLRILKNEKCFHWSCLISTIFVLGSSGSNLNMTFHNNLTLFLTRSRSTVTTTPAIETQGNDATLKLIQKILMQETLLRLELERTVTELKEDFENMKKLQMQAKTEQNILNEQFENNVTLLQIENEQLKQVISNQSSAIELHSCQCNLTDVTKGLQDFNTDFRYISLSLLDLQKETKLANDSMSIAVQNLETIQTRDRFHQTSINAGIQAFHENVSNTLKGTVQKICIILDHTLLLIIIIVQFI